MTLRPLIVRGAIFTLAVVGFVAIVDSSRPTRLHAKPSSARSPRDDLRTTIANLRGEVGLLQLEYDADRAILLEALKAHDEDMAKLDARGERVFALTQEDDFAEMFQEVIDNGQTDKARVEALKKQFDEAAAKGDKPSREKAVKGLLEAMVETDKKNYAEAMDSRKIAFKHRLVELAEKELLLEDALKRYREAE